jgi:MFS family permease
MGLGAAMVFPSTLSLLSNVFTERRERAKAIGLWGACGGVGVALGPIAGGWILERFWWGGIFVFMAAFAAAVAVAVVVAVPTSRDPATPPVDWLGLALSTAGMGLLVFGVIQAPGWSWGSASTIAVLAAGAAVLAGMVVAERASAHPMIDVRLFRNPRFTAASGAVAIASFALLGFIFLMTQFFQVVKGYKPRPITLLHSKSGSTSGPAGLPGRPRATANGVQARTGTRPRCLPDRGRTQHRGVPALAPGTSFASVRHNHIECVYVSDARG